MRRLPLWLGMSFWPRSLRPFVSFCHYDAHPGFGLWFLLKVRCFLYFFVDWEDGADCWKYHLSAAHACIFFWIQRPQIGCVSLFRHFWTSLNFKADKNKGDKVTTKIIELFNFSFMPFKTIKISRQPRQDSKEENVNATGIVFENPISLGTVLTQLRSHFWKTFASQDLYILQ